jgi:hypothetical protein
LIRNNQHSRLESNITPLILGCRNWEAYKYLRKNAFEPNTDENKSVVHSRGGGGGILEPVLGREVPLGNSET